MDLSVKEFLNLFINRHFYIFLPQWRGVEGQESQVFWESNTIKWI